MSLPLNHPVSDILRRLLVTLGAGTLPSASGSWPIHLDEPDTPDNVITVYGTVGRDDGRIQFSGERDQHRGFQVRVRAVSQIVGQAKAESVAKILDEDAYTDTVSITTDSVTSSYLVHSVSRTSEVIPIGKETPASKRFIYTINAVAALSRVS